MKRLVAAIAALLGTVGAATMSHAQAYEVVEAWGVTGPPGSIDGLQVSCPQGTNITGGGYISVSGIEVWRVFRNRSWGDDWLVSFTSVMANEPVGAYAICASLPASSGYQVVEARGFTGAPGSIGEIQVACPPGTDFLGGGYFSDSGIEVARVFRNYAWDQWYNTFTSVMGNQQVGVRAMCASLPASSRYEVVEARTNTGVPGTLGDIRVSCPPGTRILGGGYFSESGVEVWRVFRSYPSGNEWHGAFASVMENQPVGVRAICAAIPVSGAGTGTGPVMPVPASGCPTPGVPGQPYNLTGQLLYSPQSFNVEAGGTAALDDCPMDGVGYAYQQPQYSFTLSGMEAYARLEIEVASSCDPTLLVNTPSGVWVFDDDGGGELQPLLNLPLGSNMNGRLDVWVGTYDGAPCPVSLELETWN